MQIAIFDQEMRADAGEGLTHCLRAVKDKPHERTEMVVLLGEDVALLVGCGREDVFVVAGGDDGREVF